MRSHAHWWRAALAALACALLCALAVVWEPGQRLDAWLFGYAQRLNTVGPQGVLSRAARGGLPLLLAVALVLCLLRGRSRRGWRPVVHAGGLLVVSVLVSRLLRDVIVWRPVHETTYAYVHNTYPSTHVTLVAAMLVAVWWLLPRRTWWWALLGSLLLGVAMVGNVAEHAHRPSDTVGSVLLVGALASAIGRPR